MREPRYSCGFCIGLTSSPRAKGCIKPPASTAVPKTPDTPIQNTFIGKTPLAVFGRNAVIRPLNSPDREPSYVHHLFTPLRDPPLKPPSGILHCAVLRPA